MRNFETAVWDCRMRNFETAVWDCRMRNFETAVWDCRMRKDLHTLSLLSQFSVMLELQFGLTDLTRGTI
jgi:hypothetical protein